MSQTEANLCTLFEYFYRKFFPLNWYFTIKQYSTSIQKYLENFTDLKYSYFKQQEVKVNMHIFTGNETDKQK